MNPLVMSFDLRGETFLWDRYFRRYAAPKFDVREVMMTFEVTFPVNLSLLKTSLGFIKIPQNAVRFSIRVAQLSQIELRNSVKLSCVWDTLLDK